jgi:hypothetical protein
MLAKMVSTSFATDEVDAEASTTNRRYSVSKPANGENAGRNVNNFNTLLNKCAKGAFS